LDASTAGEEFSRNPTVEDIVNLCRHLNDVGAQYVIIGGFAMIHHGYIRTTADIDLLVDSAEENIRKIKNALLYLPDQAVREIDLHDVQSYTVVRIGDEIVIDLLASACGVSFDEAKLRIEYEVIEGVRIPYADAEILLRTKQGLRAQDVQDRTFLDQLLKERGKTSHR